MPKSRPVSSSVDLGKKGENLAVFSLESGGMEIIARNFRSKYGEIDIIALEGETIVFIEVKSWSVYGMEDLQYSVDIKKQSKIIKTAKYFLSTNRKYSNMAVRFDIVFVRDTAPAANHPEGAGSSITRLASAFTECV